MLHLQPMRRAQRQRTAHCRASGFSGGARGKARTSAARLTLAAAVIFTVARSNSDAVNAPVFFRIFVIKS
jgi:hypothetical protein